MELTWDDSGDKNISGVDPVEMSYPGIELFGEHGLDGAAIAFCASPGPMSSAILRAVTPAGYSLADPSGSFTVIFMN